MRRVWSAEDIDYLRKHYSNISTKDIGIELNRSINSIYGMAHLLNLKKDFFPWNLNTHGIVKPNSGSFKKGLIPWNAGTKGICKRNKTSFKKGNRPQKTEFDGAITIREGSRGGLYKWYRISKANWILYHKKIWIDSHGVIPLGYIVVFRNKNHMDCRIENLELISKAENMRRNSIQRYPEDLRIVMQQLGRLKTLINEKNKS